MSINQVTVVAHSYLTLCDPIDWSTPGLPVHHQLPELTQTLVNWVCDAIQSYHPLSTLSPPAFNLSQHQCLFKWVSSSHQVAKVLEFQLQHQSLQLIGEWKTKRGISTQWKIMVLERKEILSHATTWVNLEATMFSEISQSQKDKYCSIPLREGT